MCGSPPGTEKSQQKARKIFHEPLKALLQLLRLTMCTWAILVLHLAGRGHIPELCICVDVQGLPALYESSGTPAAAYSLEAAISGTVSYVVFSKAKRAERKGRMCLMCPQEGWASTQSVGSWLYGHLFPLGATDPCSSSRFLTVILKCH